MPNKPKISEKQILNSLKIGLSFSEIANEFGMTYDGVRKRVRNMGAKALPYMFQVESKILGVQLDTMKQLSSVNSVCLGIMFNSKSTKSEKMAAAKRIERQLEIQARFLQSIFAVREIELFQQTVVEVLAGVDPNVRDKVLCQLAAKRTMLNVIPVAEHVVQ